MSTTYAGVHDRFKNEVAENTRKTKEALCDISKEIKSLTTVLPLDSATSANQVLELSELANINNELVTLNTKVPVLGNTSSNTSVPTTQSVESVSGTITTQNLVTNGIATTGSAVELSLIGSSTLSIQVTGTYTGALSIQVTNDNSRWETITATSILNSLTGVYSATIASASIGIFQIECGGFLKARVTALGAVTGTATLTLKSINSSSLIAVSNALPTGTNSIGNIGTVTTVSTVTSANLGSPFLITDASSGAITTTTTTGGIIPTYGISYEISIPVTAVSGTNPTYDIDVQESDDTGTNYFTVYSFPRITSTGIYRSPKLLMRGNRIRYVQTLTGTSPSFTRAINRVQSNDSVNSRVSQLIDRNIVLTTLNSTTSSLNVQNSTSQQLVVNVGAITTLAPIIQLEGSDDNGSTWYSLGTALTAVASSTVSLKVNDNNSQLIRARISTAGVGVTAGYVLLKGF